MKYCVFPLKATSADRVLLDRLLTPSDLFKYSVVQDNVYFDTSDLTVLRIAQRSANNDLTRILRIPLLPPSQIQSSDPYHIEIEAGLSLQGGSEKEIVFFLSDNRKVIGIIVRDEESVITENVHICYGVEGDDVWPAGVEGGFPSLSSHNRRLSEGAQYRATSLPSKVTMLFKPNEGLGFCSVVDAVPRTNHAAYNREIDSFNGLFLDIYIDNNENHGLHYVKIKLVQEAS